MIQQQAIKMSKHKLDLQNTGTFQTAAQTSLLTVCPSMELISYGTTNNQIGINRYNGQKVYLSGQKVRGTALEIRALAWKSNGSSLSPPQYR